MSALQVPVLRNARPVSMGSVSCRNVYQRCAGRSATFMFLLVSATDSRMTVISACSIRQSGRCALLSVLGIAVVRRRYRRKCETMFAEVETLWLCQHTRSEKWLRAFWMMRCQSRSCELCCVSVTHSCVPTTQNTLQLLAHLSYNFTYARPSKTLSNILPEKPVKPAILIPVSHKAIVPHHPVLWDATSDKTHVRYEAGSFWELCQRGGGGRFRRGRKYHTYIYICVCLYAYIHTYWNSVILCEWWNNQEFYDTTLSPPGLCTYTLFIVQF
jgi:hypothetical protein